MKKFIFLFLFIYPLVANAESLDIDKYIKIDNNIANVDVLSLAKSYNTSHDIKKSYKIGNNTLEATINKGLGIVLSCKPSNNDIVIATVIREKDTKRITTFICGGDIDMNKVDKPTANITHLAYNSLYKYSANSNIKEEFVYRRANDNQDPNLKLKRYEKDDGITDKLVSYKEILMMIEKSAIEKFK